MKKELLLSTLVFTVFIANAGNDKTDNRVADKKQNSTFFKMSRNSNRLSIFEQLQSVIKIKSPQYAFGSNFQSQANQFTTYSDIIEMLGEPNVKISKSIIVYTLNPSNGCKAVIEFDGNNNVIYIGVKDCN